MKARGGNSIAPSSLGGELRQILSVHQGDTLQPISYSKAFDGFLWAVEGPSCRLGPAVVRPPRGLRRRSYGHAMDKGGSWINDLQRISRRHWLTAGERCKDTLN